MLRATSLVLGLLVIFTLVIGLLVAVPAPVLAQATPSITTNSFAGPPGTAVVVSGANFAANEAGITVTYDGASIVSGILASATGTWTSTITIPPSASGMHFIDAYGPTTLATSVADQTFSITPSISINRFSGSSGTSVFINGSGFGASETSITVTYDGTAVASGISASSTGSWSATFNVPASASGMHFIDAYGLSTSQTSVADLSFTTIPAISINRTTGSSGTPVTVSGVGFAANETGITVTYDGTPAASGIFASSTGSWSATFTIPASTSGAHIIDAYGISTPASAVLDISFTLTPGITVSKTTGSPGTPITVIGSAFGANETGITVTYDGTAVASGISANSTGSWSATFNVPPSASGSHTIDAYGSYTSAGNVSDISFTIGAGISLSRASGTTGTSVTVTGSGFSAGEMGITITYDGLTVASGISASSTGSWSATFNAPPSASGPHAIDAFGTYTQAANVPDISFTINPSISVNKASGSPGMSIAVAGSGFGANETGVIVTFDGISVASGISAGPVGSWGATFNVPASVSGSHIIDAYGSTTQAASVTDLSFVVSPGISLSRARSSPGVPITVTGSGFGVSETGITVTYDGNPVASDISANATGSWSATFNVPASVSGSHIIDAFGSTAQAASVSDVSFIVTPAISISKASGSPGMALTITGSGFGAGETGIAVTYDGTTVASSISASATGSWSANFNVPASASGSHIIDASGSTTQATSVSDVSFLIGAGISVSRASGTVGTTVTVTGSGFGSAETGIIATYDGVPVASGISASAAGSWSANFNVPASASGSHAIDAYGSITQAANIADLSFTVSPSVSIKPTAGYVGVKIEVNGSGFAANSGVRINYDGEEMSEAVASSDASGSFNLTIAAPKSKGGAHTIEVIDNSKGQAKVTFTMESNAPPTPSLVSPKNESRIGLLGGVTPTLDWSDVEDPSGVTYVVQMDTSSEFANKFLEITKVATSSYTLTKDQALARGSYYWRVKAIDGASNESAWSQPFLLKSGLMPLWTLILLIVLVMAMVGGAAYYFLLRRPRWRKAPEVVEGEVMPTPPVYVRVFKPEETPGISPATTSRKLLKQASQPSPKPAEEISPEEQVRAKMTVEFARSLPLIQPGYNVECLAELVQLASGISDKNEAYKQLLQGDATIGYEPEWRNHPLYPEMMRALEGQQLLIDLGNFIDSVGQLASEGIVLLQDIYRDALPEITEEALENRGWNFVFSIYADALGWFRGKFLRAPSEQDYLIKAEPGEGAERVFWLLGQQDTPFAGQLIQATDELHALRLRNLHLELRRKYRQSDSAKAVVRMIVQLDLLRNKVVKSLSRVDTSFEPR